MAMTSGLNFNDSNVTCTQPIKLLVRLLRNRSECHLTGAEKDLEFVLTLYIPFVLCLTGVLLNVVNFCIFRRQQFDGPAYAYMAAIALVDAIFLLFYTVYVITALRCTDHPQKFPCGTKLMAYIRWALFFPSVYVTNTINFTLQTVCAWLTVILGIERYLAMKYFHFRRTSCHRTDTKLTIVIVCTVSFVLNLPNSFHSTIVTGTRQLPGSNQSIGFMNIEQTKFGRSVYYSVYSFFKLALTALMPFLALALNNTLLLYLVLKHQRKSYANRQKYLSIKRASKVLQASLNRIQAQKNLTILLIVVIFVFLVGQVPRSLLLKDVFTFVYHGCPCSTKLLWICCPLYRRLHPICKTIYLLCLNLNFFIYVGLNKHFRSHICSDVWTWLAAVRSKLSCLPTKELQSQAGLAEGVDMELDLFSAVGGATTCDLSQHGGQAAEAPIQGGPGGNVAPSLPPPSIIFGIPAHGSPTAHRRHSCMAMSQHLANSVVHSMLQDTAAGLGGVRGTGNRRSHCSATASSAASSTAVSSSKSFGKPGAVEDAFGPREELDDLMGRSVMVSQL